MNNHIDQVIYLPIKLSIYLSIPHIYMYPDNLAYIRVVCVRVCVCEGVVRV